MTMTAAEIVKQLKPLGKESYRNVLVNHGIQEPILGVKVEDLKKFQKKIKKDYQLALDLYDTGFFDARYLAGLIADEAKMTKKDLQHWVESSKSTAVCGTTVAWVAAESPHGRELALKWIDSKQEAVAQTGWATLSSLVSVREDVELDLSELKGLLQRVERSIHQQPNAVRKAMNGFMIAAGTYVAKLSDLALKTAEKIGPVSIDVGKTSCKVPYAPDYIQKAAKRGAIGKKRKTARC
jgi:3-methyladenine DNA glycosylase AlkD